MITILIYDRDTTTKHTCTKPTLKECLEHVRKYTVNFTYEIIKNTYLEV